MEVRMEWRTAPQPRLQAATKWKREDGYYAAGEANAVTSGRTTAREDKKKR
jgi:hypothetical protein